MRITNKLAVIATKLLYSMLFIVPLGISVVTTSTYLFGKGSGGRVYLPLFLLMLVIIIIAVVMLMYSPVPKIPSMKKFLIWKRFSMPETVMCLLMFCAALLIRLFAVYVLETQPVSDFFFAHDNAGKLVEGIVDPVYQNRYGEFSSWGVWSLTIFCIYKIFGVNHFYIQVMNCLLGAVTTILIYVAAKKILHSSKMGVLAAALFLFNPTMIMYCGVLSAEHIVIFLCPILLLSLHGYLKFYTAGNSKVSLACGLAMGVSIGVIHAYRPIGIVFLVAFVLCSILYRNVHLENKRKSLILLAAVLGIMALANTAVSAASNAVLKHTMKIEGSINAGYSLGRMLLMGVGLDEEGNYSKYVAREFTDSYRGDPKDFSKACLKEAAWYVRTYYDKYPKVFYEKLCTAFGRPNRYPETGFTTWIYQSTTSGRGSMDEEHPFAREYLQISSTVLGQYYVILIFFAMLGCLYYLCRKCEYEMFFLSLFIFGFTLILILGESQGRYKSVLFPYLSILAAVGIWNACRFLVDLCHKYVARKQKIFDGQETKE